MDLPLSKFAWASATIHTYNYNATECTTANQNDSSSSILIPIESEHTTFC